MRDAFKERALDEPRWGYRTLGHILRTREGWKDNDKGIYRVYAEEGLQVGKRILGSSTGVGETPAEDHPQMIKTKSYLAVAANAADEKTT